jgi:hypothetical protein
MLEKLNVRSVKKLSEFQSKISIQDIR